MEYEKKTAKQDMTNFVQAGEYNRIHRVTESRRWNCYAIGGDSIYKVYIDTYFLFNFWMNLWVLFLCRFFIRSKVRGWKVAVAALITSLCETIVLCVPYGSSMGKIILGYGGIMALCTYGLFRPKSRSYFCKLLIYNYLTIFVLGGTMILIESLGGKKYFSPVSWSLLVVLLVFLIEIILGKIQVKNDIYQVMLTITENRKCLVTALCDSGNGLEEPISKVPVSIVEENFIRPYKEGLKQEKFRMVPFHSIGKERGLLEAYFIEKMEIISEGENRIIFNPIIAITKDRISAGESYQMILHPALLEQGGRNSDI